MFGGLQQPVSSFLAFASWRYLRYKSPYKRLQSLGEQIRKALLDSGHLTDDQSRVQVEEDKENYMVFAYLKGGSMRDKELFSQTVGEFFCSSGQSALSLEGRESPTRSVTLLCRA